MVASIPISIRLGEQTIAKIYHDMSIVVENIDENIVEFIFNGDHYEDSFTMTRDELRAVGNYKLEVLADGGTHDNLREVVLVMTPNGTRYDDDITENSEPSDDDNHQDDDIPETLVARPAPLSRATGRPGENNAERPRRVRPLWSQGPLL